MWKTVPETEKRCIQQSLGFPRATLCFRASLSAMLQPRLSPTGRLRSPPHPPTTLAGPSLLPAKSQAPIGCSTPGTATPTCTPPNLGSSRPSYLHIGPPRLSTGPCGRRPCPSVRNLINRRRARRGLCQGCPWRRGGRSGCAAQREEHGDRYFQLSSTTLPSSPPPGFPWDWTLWGCPLRTGGLNAAIQSF